MKLVAEDPLISDQRVARIEGLMRMRYPALPGDAVLFTYVQPPDKSEGRDRVAVFGVTSKDPKGREVKLMTTGSMWFKDWTRETWAHERLVGIPDPAIEKFRQVVTDHVAKIQSIREGRGN